MRSEREYKTCCWLNYPGRLGPNGFERILYSVYQYLLFERLQKSTDSQVAAIAVKSLKEVTYHLRWSSEWVIRLGDGTEKAIKGC